VLRLRQYGPWPGRSVKGNDSYKGHGAHPNINGYRCFHAGTHPNSYPIISWSPIHYLEEKTQNLLEPALLLLDDVSTLRQILLTVSLKTAPASGSVIQDKDT
jgi:hypothetical protein